MTCGKLGVIEEIHLDHGYDFPLATIPLRVSKYASESSIQPHYFEGEFEYTIRLNFLDTRYNHFRLVAADPIFGRCADCQFVFQIEVESMSPENQEAHTEEPPIVELSCVRTDYQVASRQTHFHPLLCRVQTDQESLTSGFLRIPTLVGNRTAVMGPGGDYYLADAKGVRPEVLLAIPDDLPSPFAPGFPPDMHPWFSTPIGEWESLRPTDLPKPFTFAQTDQGTQQRFVEEFNYGFVKQGIGLYAGRKQLARIQPANLDGSRERAMQINWQWTRRSSRDGSVPTWPRTIGTVPQCQRVGEIIFKMLAGDQIGEADVAAHVLQGNCHLLGIQDLPEEYRRLLEYGYELFETYLGNCDANHHLDEAAQNLGRGYRESLGVLAPFSSPKFAVKQLNVGKHEFWLLLKGSSKAHSQSKSDEILEWAFIKILSVVEWLLSKRPRR